MRVKKISFQEFTLEYLIDGINWLEWMGNISETESRGQNKLRIDLFLRVSPIFLIHYTREMVDMETKVELES